MAAHRYWRIRCTAANGNPIAATEIEFHSVVGGTMDYSGIGIASSFYGGGYEIANAFDQNIATIWAAAGNVGEWIGYDFGAGNALDIQEISWRARVDSPDQTPSAALVEYSDDAAAWTASWAINFGAFTGGQVQTKDKPAPPPAGHHQYWRLKWDSSVRGFCSCATLEMRETVGGADVTTTDPSLAIDGTEYSGAYGAQYAFDRDASTAWSSGAAADWVGFNFGDGNYVQIVEMVYLPRSGDLNASPTAGGIEYSDDKAIWTRLTDIVPPEGGYADGVPVTFDTPPPNTPEIKSSEGRIFAIVKQNSQAEELSGARVFGVYRHFTQAAEISQVSSFVVVNKHFAIEATQLQTLAVVKGRVANPAVRAWRFTLDGHNFYVLRLGDAMTKLYDDSTQQWTEWETPTSGAWKPNTGFNWIGAQALAHTYGSEVVVGDDTFGLLYFLDPKLQWDESPYGGDKQLPFDRIVTAQALANGRQYLPCYAIFVGGDDYGLVARDFTPQITLETSDDQGRTFFAHDTLDVEIDPDVDGNYGWYSLGQIQSPGRIFRITDNGVFTRIDNVEMNDDAG